MLSNSFSSSLSLSGFLVFYWQRCDANRRHLPTLLPQKAQKTKCASATSSILIYIIYMDYEKSHMTTLENILYQSLEHLHCLT